MSEIDDEIRRDTAARTILTGTIMQALMGWLAASHKRDAAVAEKARAFDVVCTAYPETRNAAENAHKAAKAASFDACHAFDKAEEALLAAAEQLSAASELGYAEWFDQNLRRYMLEHGEPTFSPATTALTAAVTDWAWGRKEHEGFCDCDTCTLLEAYVAWDKEQREKKPC